MASILYCIDCADRFVYHYTSPKAFAEHILPSGRIRFSRFTRTNDPRECRDWKLGLWVSNGVRNFTHHEWELLQTKAAALLRENCRLFCASMDDVSAVGLGPDKIYGRGFCKPRMWDQYAARHTGACLIIDRVLFDAQVRKAIGVVSAGSKVHHGPVNYENIPQVPVIPHGPFILNGDDVRAIGLEGAIERHLGRYHRQIFFKKPQDWADEREVRWLLHLCSDDDLYVLLADSLQGIVITPDFPQEYQQAIECYATAHRIEVGVLRWMNGSPEIVPSILACGRAAGAGS